ncbi:hypothetical protein [Actinospica robiniae]|uniref:hypothetical protein n=1 Tax=Actinospica robiniae TaxID=304901 RepID=UPI000686A4E2|nr:hypothetical protein [Actinospica robiniae]
MSAMDSGSLLFNRGELTEVLRMRRAEALRQVDQWEGEELLRIPAAEVIDAVVAEHTLECPRLDRDAIEHVETGETVVSGVRNFGRAGIVQAQTRIVVAVPYTGDRLVFDFRPPTFQSVVPRASVLDGELHLVWIGSGERPETVKAYFGKELDTIELWLSWSRTAVEAFTRELRAVVEGRVQQRYAGLQARQSLTASLGFKQRSASPTCSTVPITRRKITVARPPSVGPFRPDPALDTQTYEQILAVLRSQMISLERTASTTAKLDEEEIRDLLLSTLNGQFDLAGRARGETFNCMGKTDILVNVDGKNVFIAECKFWHGPKKWSETVDQLLRYLTWRDTKGALLLFMRRGAPSHIIAEAVRTIENHRNYKTTINVATPREHADFVLRTDSDPNSEVTFAQLPFHLPLI